MSPQFVDFDGDGQLDILTATFDGAVHLARGDGDAFREPEHVLDQKRRHITLNEYHTRSKKWVDTHRCDPKGGVPSSGHMTACVAMDIDRDGDLDLILGDHKAGYVYVRCNKGTAKRPKFATRNELLMYEGHKDRYVRVLHGVMSLRVVDWNGDGRDDLLITSASGLSLTPGSGVYVCMDSGQRKPFTPSPLEMILPLCDRRLQLGPDRVTDHVYADLGDVDGDGDLDLIVGGTASWRTSGKPTTGRPNHAMAKLLQESKEISAEVAKGAVITMGMTDEESGAKAIQKLKGNVREALALGAKLQQVRERVRKALPKEEKGTFLWFYENLSAGAQKTRAKGQ